VPDLTNTLAYSFWSFNEENKKFFDINSR